MFPMGVMNNSYVFFHQQVFSELTTGISVKINIFFVIKPGGPTVLWDTCESCAQKLGSILRHLMLYFLCLIKIIAFRAPSPQSYHYKSHSSSTDCHIDEHLNRKLMK